MKKIILVAGMFYVATSGAMVGRALLIATPALVPGVYYTAQCYIDEQAVSEKHKDGSTPDETERTVEILNTGVPLTNYIDGFFRGLIVPLNVMILTGKSQDYCGIKKVPADEKVGFFAGFSTLTSLLIATSLLKKMPK